MANSTDSIDVRYVAHLARLHLSDDEATLFQGQLDQILDQVRTLSELAVDPVDPATPAVPVHTVFRADEVQPSLDHAVAMRNAPHARNGLFMVPKILE